jgi:acyl-CoA thioester hydrolase
VARVEPWRLDATYYPIAASFETRFQDMDINGHLNNVAFAALFESARVMMNRRARPLTDRPANERTMVAAVTINYLAEGHFPGPVTMHSGIGSIGSSSWTIVQVMLQAGRAIATCDTVVVCRTDNAAKPLRAELRAALEADRVRVG